VWHWKFAKYFPKNNKIVIFTKGKKIPIVFGGKQKLFFWKPLIGYH
jgi:hypothetical protein